MKRIRNYAIYIIIFSNILLSCKPTLNKPVANNLRVEVESNLIKSKIKDKMVNDSLSKVLSKISLNGLLKMYSTPIEKANRNLTKAIIFGEIVKRHEIDSDTYAEYRDNFWNRETSYIHSIDYDELKTKLSSASDTDYVLFTFTKERVANDFHIQIVKDHVFNSFVSCFPAVILKQMIEDSDYNKITVGKGIKYLVKPPYLLHPGNFNIAMLKYFDKKGNVQYFDIVEDPGH